MSLSDSKYSALTDRGKRSDFFKFGILYLLILVFVFSGTALAVDEKPDLKFRRVYEGLLSNRVSTIYQDNMGYIWIGTYSGLHRYNGTEFDIYTSSADSSSISDNLIGSIYEDSLHNVWVGTSNGVNRYNREQDNFIRYELPSSASIPVGLNTIINTIIEDKSGTLWIGGGSEGLYFLDREKQQFVPFGNLSGILVNAITADENNNLWIATAGEGLIRVNPRTGETKTFEHDPSNPSSIASSMLSYVITGPKGNLWIGTQDQGVDRMEVKDGEAIFHHYRHEPGNPNSLGNNFPLTMYVDNEENLWIGNDNGGLHLYNEETDSFFRYESNPNDPTSLTHNSIWCVFQDAQGSYWVGTGQTGINVADPYYSKFIHYSKNASKEYSLNNNIIRDFYAIDNNHIYIGTDGGGINYFDRNAGTFRAYQHDPNDPQSLRSNAIISLGQDDEGNLWAGTWEGGLNILTDPEQGTFTTFKEKIDNFNYSIRSIFDFIFDDQYIWIGGYTEGLFRYNKENNDLRIYSSDPNDPASLSSNLITKILRDSEGNIWVGTLAGLNVLPSKNQDEGTFKQFLHSAEDSTSIAGNSIQDILEDRNHNIWAATNYGLSKYIREEERFKNFNKTDGLPINEIRSLIEDDNGDIWIGTNNGLSRFDPEEETFTNFDKSDGLQNTEFSQYSVLKLPSGELLFGGLSGFNVFHPDDIKDNPHIPPVYLTDFKLFNKSVDIRDSDSPLQKHISIADTLILSYDQDVITFDFIALNYTRSEYNQYAYMIEGFEDDWNYVGTQRNATYTNLDPGEYTFRVKASNNDGVWNEEGASLMLIITPPFWQTTWFYILSGIFIIGGIFTIYRFRVRSIRRHNLQLEQQVADRTQELKEKNKHLEVTLNELEETKNELVEKAHKAGMADIATGVLHNIGNILTSVNTSASLIEDTVKQSKVEGLVQANMILRQNLNQIEKFIANDPKGKSLLQYYLKLEDPLKNEREKVMRQSERLNEKIELINEVIAAQQNYAGIGAAAEKTSLTETIENALALQAGSIERHGLHVEKDLQTTEQITVQPSKLINVLINIIKNAKEAMANNKPDNRKIIIKAWEEDDQIFLSFTDNGEGIKKEHIDKIFSHGFTTKKNGHGFGLHSCANYMREMKGKIKVESEGKGKGATFTLCFKKTTDTQPDKQIETPEMDTVN